MRTITESEMFLRFEINVLVFWTAVAFRASAVSHRSYARLQTEGQEAGPTVSDGRSAGVLLFGP